MENNNMPPINPRILTIEIWDNNKICLPAFIPPDDHKISIDELKQALALLKLIIDNPANFHIVKPGFELKKNVICQSHSNCEKCEVGLLTKSMTERENGLCFDCEKKGILDEVNKPKICDLCCYKAATKEKGNAFFCDDCFDISEKHRPDIKSNDLVTNQKTIKPHTDYCQICEAEATKITVDGMYLCDKCHTRKERK